MNCLWILITTAGQPVELCWLVDTTARTPARIAMSGLMAGLVRRTMEFARPLAEDLTQPAVTAAKQHATAKSHVHFARSHARSAAIIRNAPNCAKSLAYHVLSPVPGLVHIAGGVYYHVQFPAICYRARSAAQRY
jgi:hypothetical protein